MTLAARSRFGHYEITGSLGKGGMGEVYRARDTSLGRDVAIKTLPEGLATDTDRLARFEREARLLASLNHAHIASIYSLDEHDGTRYLAMELVDGVTLEEKLKSGPLPVETALELALQIAQALEAAHGKGVMHRDLKPANVMVTKDGVVKVLDFGLAKAFSTEDDGAPEHSPALSLAMAQAGLILGTAGYMSPEQASGQGADQRADIWAFGVVLYEMLTGQPAFSGESVPHILADVLKAEPDWKRLPVNLHPRLRILLERCLVKKPRDRLHSIADVRIELEALLREPESGLTRTAEAKSATRRLSLGIAAAIVLTAAISALTAWLVWPAAAERPVRRFTYTIPEDEMLRSTPVGVFSLAPDGSRFIYNTERGIVMRSMDALEAQVIPGTEADLGQPFFSADGNAIAFFNARAQALERIAISGGRAVTISHLLGGLPLGARWEDDGMIYSADADTGISRVLASGGEPEPLIAKSNGELFQRPQLLPDGDTILFSVATRLNDWDRGSVVVQSLTTGQRDVLIQNANSATYVDTGHLLYASGSDLFAVAFDLQSRRVPGAPISIAEGVFQSSTSGIANYGIANDGTLAYLRGARTGAGRLYRVTPDGQSESLNLPGGNFDQPRLSPDGTRLAYGFTGADANTDIWVLDLERRIPTRLTFEAGMDSYPIWTPNGSHIIFWSERDGGGLYRQAADGTGAAERLTGPRRNGIEIPSAFTPDGSRLLLYSQNTTSAESDLYVLSTGSGEPPEVLVGTPFDEDFSDLSPDGHWLVYSSDESGSDQVYVRPFPNADAGKWQVSGDYGIDPVWAPDGKELYYRTNDAVMVVRVETEPTFVAALPEPLFRTEARLVGVRGSFDVTPDGETFYMFSSSNSVAGDRDVVIVENFTEELKRLLPVE